MKDVKGIQTVTMKWKDAKDGLTIVELRPGNTVRLEQLRQVIKDRGFVPADASVVAQGSARGERAFLVGGTNEELPLSAAPRQVDGGWRLAVPSSRP